LSMTAEPPEILYETTVLDEPAPSETIVFSALVLNPSGEPVVFHWSYCPVESAHACNDFQELRAQAPPEFLDELDTLRGLVREGEVAPLPVSVGRSPATWWHEMVPGLVATISSAGAKYFLREDNALAVVTGAWPSAVLEVQAGQEHVKAVKRVVLNLRDPGAVLTRYLSVTVCPAGLTPDDVPGCLPVHLRIANQNPTFANIQVARGTDPSVPFEDPPSGTLTMSPRESIRILPILGAGAFDTYQTLRGGIQNNQAEIVDEVEDTSVSWYCSAGALDHETTWPEMTKTLDNVYTAPGVPPANTQGVVTLWLVARDQRGGEGWTNLDIRIVARR
jgi:hypothetical protein